MLPQLPQLPQLPHANCATAGLNSAGRVRRFAPARRGGAAPRDRRSAPHSALAACARGANARATRHEQL